MIRFIFLFLGINAIIPVKAQQTEKLPSGEWRAILVRSDGNSIAFNFEVKDSLDRQMLFLQNADERIPADSIRLQHDSVRILLPFFDSEIRAQLTDDHSLRGIWIKHLAVNDQIMPLLAYNHQSIRFTRETPGPPCINVTGRWSVVFRGPDGHDSTPAVGEFVQIGDRVTGTFLHPTGDMRYLDGIADGDSIKLSCFDGGHAYLFTARIDNNKTIVRGTRFSGPVYREIWTAQRDPGARLPDEFSQAALKPGESRLQFSFTDIDGKKISIRDDRYKNKVVLIQLMGSWCPNCMDETRFLIQAYEKYHARGLEIMALAYERSTDKIRSRKSLRSFRQRLGVPYPILITGVSESDSLLTEKTLPQIDHMAGFPTSIFIARSGKVKKILTGFNGPATGEHFQEEKQTVYRTLEELLAEKNK